MQGNASRRTAPAATDPATVAPARPVTPPPPLPPRARPRAPSDASLPLQVDAFLGAAGLAHHAGVFAASGYDDVRVVASLSAEDAFTLGLNATDIAALQSAGLDWTAHARASGLLENWAREVHRAGATGVFVPLDPAAAAAAQGAPGARDPNFMYDAKGRIDMKKGDEAVQMGWGDSRDWNPTPVLRALYDAPPQEEEEGEAEEADDAPAQVSMEGYLEKLPAGVRTSSLLHKWQRRYFRARDGELHYYIDSKSSEPQVRLAPGREPAGRGPAVRVTDNAIVANRHAVIHALDLIQPHCQLPTPSPPHPHTSTPLPLCDVLIGILHIARKHNRLPWEHAARDHECTQGAQPGRAGVVHARGGGLEVRPRPRGGGSQAGIRGTAAQGYNQ